MQFISKVGEDEFYASVWDGRIQFSCNLIEDKKFDSLDALERAVASYKLTLRKQFSNPVAYRMSGYARNSDIQAVTVTSICDDGKYAWITINGRRAKEPLSSLFTSKEDLESAREFETAQQKLIAEKWAATERWKPASSQQ